MVSDRSPKAEVESAIRQFFRAMDTQDFGLMKSLVSHDAEMVHIGTDRGEIWRGWEDLRTATIEQFEGMEYYRAEIYDLQINLAASAEVAWYSHMLDARIKSNGVEHVWEGARFTGVFERQEGRWAMVQTHVSLPESA